MKKIILLLMIVIYSVNTSTSLAQNNFVPVEDFFVFYLQQDCKDASIKNNNVFLASNILLTLRNLETGVVYTAKVVEFSAIPGFSDKYARQYILKTNQVLRNIKADDSFELTIGFFNPYNTYITEQTSFAGVEQPELIHGDTRYKCYLDGNTLSSITKTPIPIASIVLKNK